MEERVDEGKVEEGGADEDALVDAAGAAAEKEKDDVARGEGFAGVVELNPPMPLEPLLLLLLVKAPKVGNENPAPLEVEDSEDGVALGVDGGSTTMDPVGLGGLTMSVPSLGKVGVEPHGKADGAGAGGTGAGDEGVEAVAPNVKGDVEPAVVGLGRFKEPKGLDGGAVTGLAALVEAKGLVPEEADEPNEKDAAGLVDEAGKVVEANGLVGVVVEGAGVAPKVNPPPKAGLGAAVCRTREKVEKRCHNKKKKKTHRVRIGRWLSLRATRRSSPS